tara:strand:- start:99 stop:479 length:381 start_codon:yes stop_codon:yes gene_type:complete
VGEALDMGKIQVNNIKLYGYHGCLAEESIIGSWYKIDLEVDGDLSISSVTDNLSDTIDYVHLNQIVKKEMAIRSKLLEAVAKRILERVFLELEAVHKGHVRIAKLNPPIGGNVEEVAIILSKKRSG